MVFFDDKVAIEHLKETEGWLDGGDFIFYLKDLTTNTVIIDNTDESDGTSLEECEEYLDLEIL